MSIDFDTFLKWAIDRFGSDNVKVRHTSHGDEICTHSYFALEKLGKVDTKYHLWMSPEGGKRKSEYGVYRCWLTDSMGSLVSLVSDYDNIPYEEAEEVLGASLSLRSLEQKVHAFFGTIEEEKDEEIISEIKQSEELPPFTYLINGLPANNYMKIRASNILKQRKIPTEDLYVCTKGEYGNRIVIPYYDANGKLIWWNARTMSFNKKVLRYRKPEESQDEILYMTRWPRAGHKVYIMEGEFDAKTLDLAELVGCACGGKHLSPEQIETIRGYIPVLCFDTDESGLKALIDVGRSLLSRGFKEIYYVRPPKAYKDWNNFLIERDIETIKNYIKSFEKPLTETALDLLESRKI